MALGESLATQDNIQLMSTSMRYYFQHQVLSLNGKGLDGVVLDKVMKGLGENRRLWRRDGECRWQNPGRLGP